MIPVGTVVGLATPVIADVEVDIGINKVLIKGVDGLQGGPCSLIGCE